MIINGGEHFYYHPKNVRIEDMIINGGKAEVDRVNIFTVILRTFTLK